MFIYISGRTFNEYLTSHKQFYVPFEERRAQDILSLK